MIEENGWDGRKDMEEEWIVWGGYEYGEGEEGKEERGIMEERMSQVKEVVKNKDNREKEIIESDEY